MFSCGATSARVSTISFIEGDNPEHGSNLGFLVANAAFVDRTQTVPWAVDQRFDMGTKLPGVAPVSLPSFRTNAPFTSTSTIPTD